MEERKIPPGTTVKYLMKVGAWWGEAFLPGVCIIIVGPHVVRHDAEVELNQKLQQYREE
jgi:hypothetical protein